MIRQELLKRDGREFLERTKLLYQRRESAKFKLTDCPDANPGEEKQDERTSTPQQSGFVDVLFQQDAKHVRAWALVWSWYQRGPTV